MVMRTRGGRACAPPQDSPLSQLLTPCQRPSSHCRDWLQGSPSLWRGAWLVSAPWEHVPCDARSQGSQRCTDHSSLSRWGRDLSSRQQLGVAVSAVPCYVSASQTTVSLRVSTDQEALTSPRGVETGPPRPHPAQDANGTYTSVLAVGNFSQ